MKPLLFLRCPFRVVCYMCYAFARGPFVRQQLASLAVDGGPLATAPHIPQTTLTGLRKSSAIIHVGSLRSPDYCYVTTRIGDFERDIRVGDFEVWGF